MPAERPNKTSSGGTGFNLSHASFLIESSQDMNVTTGWDSTCLAKE